LDPERGGERREENRLYGIEKEVLVPKATQSKKSTGVRGKNRFVLMLLPSPQKRKERGSRRNPELDPWAKGNASASEKKVGEGQLTLTGKRQKKTVQGNLGGEAL